MRQQQSDHYDPQYDIAYRRMKKIKGFYVHLVIYILVNLFFLYIQWTEITKGNPELFWSFKSFTTAIFWGMGLVGHGLSVFGRDFLFGRHWEERKIRELMNSDKTDKWE